MIGLLTWKLIEDMAFIDNTKLSPSQKFHVPYNLKKTPRYLRPLRSDVPRHPAAPHPDLHILYFPEGI